MLLLLVPPGKSPMQLAEEDAANDKGVRVLTIDVRDVRGEAFDYHFDEMPLVKALRDEAAQVAAGLLTLKVPPTREELEQMALHGGSDAIAAGKEGHTMSQMPPQRDEEPEPDFDA